MPLSPSDLTTYHLDYTDGRFASAVLEPETRAVSLLPVRLVGFNASSRRGEPTITVPVFRAHCLHGEHTIAPNAILFEPYELPTVLRDLLWPPSVPVESSPPVALSDLIDNKTAPTSPRGTAQLDEYMATTGLLPERVIPFPAAGNIDDEPGAESSSDYAGPAF